MYSKHDGYVTWNIACLSSLTRYLIFHGTYFLYLRRYSKYLMLFFIFIYLITESISFPIYIINKMSETYYIYLRTAHYVSKISFTFEKLWNKYLFLGFIFSHHIWSNPWSRREWKQSWSPSSYAKVGVYSHNQFRPGLKS